ncbi:MAG: hypothetical protein Q9221_004568 [Calogaya cf. arnoldii]
MRLEMGTASSSERLATTTADSKDEPQGTRRSYERLATATAVSEEEDRPQGHQRSYERLLEEARKDYPNTLPPFIHHKSSRIEAGHTKEVILADLEGQFPYPMPSVRVIRARQWDRYKNHCFWTLDIGGDRLILAARVRKGVIGGRGYIVWLGKDRGVDGFSELTYAYAPPTATMVARYPHYFEEFTARSLPTSSKSVFSTDESDVPSPKVSSTNEVTSRPVTRQTSALMIPNRGKEIGQEPNLGLSQKITKLPTIKIGDVDEIIRQDRAFFGNDAKPPYVFEKRREGHQNHLSSFTAVAVDKHGHGTEAAIQVRTRNWDRHYRCWVAELDGKEGIVKKTAGGNSAYRLRLWLGHELGLGEVVGIGYSLNALKVNDRRDVLTPGYTWEEGRRVRHQAHPDQRRGRGRGCSREQRSITRTYWSGYSGSDVSYQNPFVTTADHSVQNHGESVWKDDHGESVCKDGNTIDESHQKIQHWVPSQ